MGLRSIGRSVNWLENTSRLIETLFPEIRPHSNYVTKRMAALLLERLTADTGRALLDLLPGQRTSDPSLRESARGMENRSIGYPDFVERATHSLGAAELPLALIGDFARKVADAFLWTVAEEIPSEIKSKMADELPLELKSRMSLYSAGAEEAKVA